jgi:hypothetical protein
VSAPRARAALLVLASALAGCAAVPYPLEETESEVTLRLRPGEPQIERGRPNAFLDGLGHHVLSLPQKLLLFSWRVDNHDISPETEAALREYLDANGLRNVKVRLNQYAPGGEWRRLARNRELNGFWRWTLGLISVLSYTVQPGRVFGGDHYNPYTNTIHLFSDHASIALHEAGHAKDFALREWKGLYSLIRVLPLVPLYQEGIATGDAIGYHRHVCDAEGERDDYEILYPAYSTYISGEGLRWVAGPTWLEYAVMYGLAIPAHVVGRIRAAAVDEPGCAPPEASPPESLPGEPAPREVDSEDAPAEAAPPL